MVTIVFYEEKLNSKRTKNPYLIGERYLKPHNIWIVPTVAQYYFKQLLALGIP